MIKLDYIREFVVLAETLNFSRTAEKCYITQPVLSKHIAILEAEFKTSLLNRNTRHVSLTKAGQCVYEQFALILDTYNKTQIMVDEISGQNNITICSPYYWTAEFTEPLVDHFLQSNPECTVNILACQPVQGLEKMLQGECDIFIGATLGTENISPTIQRIPFAAEPLCAVVCEDHPFFQKESICLEDIRTEKNVVLLREDHPLTAAYNKKLLDILHTVGCRPEKIYYSPQIDTIGMSLKKYGGICLSTYSIKQLNRSYIKAVPLNDITCDLNVFYSEENQKDSVAKFIKTVQKQLRTVP